MNTYNSPKGLRWLVLTSAVSICGSECHPAVTTDIPTSFPLTCIPPPPPAILLPSCHSNNVQHNIIIENYSPPQKSARLTLFLFVYMRVGGCFLMNIHALFVSEYISVFHLIISICLLELVSRSHTRGISFKT